MKIYSPLCCVNDYYTGISSVNLYRICLMFLNILPTNRSRDLALHPTIALHVPATKNDPYGVH